MVPWHVDLGCRQASLVSCSYCLSNHHLPLVNTPMEFGILHIMLAVSVWQSTQASFLCKLGRLCPWSRWPAPQSVCGQITSMRYLDRFSEADLGGLRQAVLKELSGGGTSAQLGSVWWEKLCGGVIMRAAAEEQSLTLYEILFHIATNSKVLANREYSFALKIGLTSFCDENRDSIEHLLWESHIRTWRNRPVGFIQPMRRADVQLRYAFAQNLPFYCPSLLESSQKLRIISLAQRVFWEASQNRRIVDGVQTVSYSPDDPWQSLQQLETTPGPMRVKVEQFGATLDNEPIRIEEWFGEIASLMFTPGSGVFSPRDDVVTTNLSRFSTDVTELQTSRLRGVGRFLAAAIVEQIPVPIYLPSAAYAFLANVQLTLEDIEQDHPKLYRKLNRILRASEAELADDAEWGFATDEPPITIANRHVYINQQLRRLVDEVACEKLSIVKQGFHASGWPMAMDRRVRGMDFKLMVSGSQSIDMDDFAKNLDRRAFAADDRQLEWLVSDLRRAHHSFQRKFLLFVTGSSQLPMGGFAALPRPVTIVPWPYMTDTRFPEGYPMTDRRTFTLALPKYRDRLLQFAHIDARLSAAKLNAFGRRPNVHESPVCERIPTGTGLTSAWAENTRDLIATILSPRTIPVSYSTDPDWVDNCGLALLEEARDRIFSHPDILLPLFTLATLSAGNAGQESIFAHVRKLDNFCTAHTGRIRDWLMEYRSKHRGLYRPQSWAVSDNGLQRNRFAIIGGIGADIPYWCASAFRGSDPHLPILRAWALRQHIYRRAMRGPPLNGLVIRPTRAAVLTESVAALMGDGRALRGGVEWISFEGEEGRGPGIIREWFSEMVSQFIGHQPPLIELSPDAPHYLRLAPVWTEGADQGTQLTRLEAMGRFMALAVVQDVPVALNFPVMFFARLLDRKVNLEDIKTDEPHLYSSLSLALAYTPEQLADLGGIEIDGAYVDLTVQNRRSLIEHKVKSLIGSEVQQQLAAVTRGFRAILQPFLGRDFPLNASDLKSIVVGTSTVDIDDMMSHTVFHGYSLESPQIVWLRTLLNTFDDATRRKFLRFVTGLEAVPTGGFASLQNPFTIDIRHGSADALPTAATCYHLLRLPSYRTEDQLRERVTLAVMADGAFGEL